MGFLSFLGGLFGFGGYRNPIVETVEGVSGVFMPNAEREAMREWDGKAAALDQFGREFHYRSNRTWFDVFVDGLNRLIRPGLVIGFCFVIPFLVVEYPEQAALAIGTLALLPSEYWYIVGTMVLFFFGGRMQTQALEVKKELTAAAAQIAARPKFSVEARRIGADHPLVAHVKDAQIKDDVTDDREYVNVVVERWNEKQR